MKPTISLGENTDSHKINAQPPHQPKLATMLRSIASRLCGTLGHNKIGGQDIAEFAQRK